MEQLKNWLSELSNSSKLLGVIVLLCLGYLVYKHIDTNTNKLPYIGFVATYGLVWVYVTDCLSKGNCGLISWVFAIMTAISLLFISGLISEIPYKVLIDIKNQSKLCVNEAAISNPEYMKSATNIVEKMFKIKNFLIKN